LVLDGSVRPTCRQAALSIATRLSLPLRLEQRPAQGIYVAMNQAVLLAHGQLLAFMHAGDRYLPGGLTALVEHWFGQGTPPAVFGQAWIQPGDGLRAWLTPDPAMGRLDRWLLAMVPCHQAFLFDRTFAREHPYRPGSLVADRSVMRAALAAAGSAAYLPKPVCEFDLTGVSSRLPAGWDVLRRLQDPQRSVLERVSELVKGVLRPMIRSNYPRVMRWRSRLWGQLCR